MRLQVLKLSAAMLCLIGSYSAFAQTVADPENVRAEDVAMSPLADINMKKREVPPVLEAALIKPYDVRGIATCEGLSAAVSELDAVLGDDIDVAYAKTGEEKAGNSVGAVAKSVISSFIPFRGIIREISGANAQERAWQLALYAGAVRRAFLKGVGEQRGCAYPARSATAQVLASLSAQREEDRAQKPETGERGSDKTTGASGDVNFVSVPVVQTTAPPR
jgi:hypothetical protein